METAKSARMRREYMVVWLLEAAVVRLSEVAACELIEGLIALDSGLLRGFYPRGISSLGTDSAVHSKPSYSVFVHRPSV